MLTKTAIDRAMITGDITIDPYDPRRLCANSYAFTLGTNLLEYAVPAGAALDPHRDNPIRETTINETGHIIEPWRLYLGHTRETMGATRYATTLHACRSVSSLGLRIQLSAPLGHCGAVIPWTLELRSTVPVRIYPGMTIGKIAWWSMRGQAQMYQGRYSRSRSVVRSLIAADQPPCHTSTHPDQPTTTSHRDVK